MSDQTTREIGKSAYLAADLTLPEPLFFHAIGSAAIAAATPHIRRQVIEELIGSVDPGSDPIVYYHINEHGGMTGATTLIDWLRSHLETKP